MELSEMTLQYNGFHPSDYTREYLESMMDELYTESPHGSILQAVFSRQGQSFKARVRIDCSGAHFFAVASGRRLKEVTHKLVQQIRKQQGKWKSLRLQGRRLSQIPYDFDFDANELKYAAEAQMTETAQTEIEARV